MFNLFKNAAETNKAAEEKTNAVAAKNNQQQAEKKPVHGEDGVCCGGCGGQAK